SPLRSASFCTTMPACCSSTSMTTSSIGSSRSPDRPCRNSTFGRDTESSKPSRRMVSIRMPSCNSPRPATSIESFSLDSELRNGRRGQAGDGDDVAGEAFLDRRALKSAEGEHLGNAAFLDQSAVSIEILDGLIGPHRAGADAAGDNTAEIRIGLQYRAQHTER